RLDRAPRNPTRLRAAQEFLTNFGIRHRQVQQLRDARFRLDGKVVAGFQTTAKGCSYYPFDGTTRGDPRQGPRGLRASEVRASFRTGEPLPVALVKERLDPHGRG